MKRSILAILITAAVTGVGFAQGADDCAGAGAFPLALGANAGTNVGSTTSAGFSNPCVTLNSDVWFSFTPVVTDCYRFDTDTAGGLTDTVLAVYSGCALEPMACDDDSGTVVALASSLTVPLYAGVTYFVQVGDWSTSVTTGVFTLTVAQITCTPDANDLCGNATIVGTGTNPAPAASGFTYSNANSAGEGGYPAACQPIWRDQWFSFSPAATGVYLIDTDTPAGFAAGTHTDTTLAVYLAPCGAAAPLACDADSGGGNLSSLAVSLTAGSTYNIRVGSDGNTSSSFGGTSGTFYLNVNFLGAPPANDECATPTVVGLGSILSNNNAASTSVGVGAPCSALINDVWFDFTPAVTDCYLISTENGAPAGTLTDTVVAVYTACAGATVACDNDAGTGSLSSLVATLTGGVTYNIRVGALSTAAPAYGTFWLNIAQGCIAGDDCSNAIPLSLGANPTPAANGFMFDNTLSTSATGWTAACATLTRDMFFSFTPAVTGAYVFDTNTPCGFTTAGTLTNTTAALYDMMVAACPGGGANIGCDADGGVGSLSRVGATLTAGNLYMLRVGSTAATTVGTFYVNVSMTTAAPSNDLCAAPITVVTGTNPAPAASCNTFSNDGATSQSPAWVAVCGVIGNDVWFSYTTGPGGGGSYIIDTNTPCGFAPGTATNTTLAVYPTGCVSVPALASDCDSGQGSLSLVAITLAASTTYIIRVGVTATTGTGTFYLNINPGTITPPNDDCATALPVVAGVNPAPGASCVTYDNTFATSDVLGYPAVCGTIVNDLWFVFTPVVSGDYVIDTETPPGFQNGSATNTTLAVYGSCAVGPALLCDADSGTTNGGLNSVVTAADLVGGTPVYIRVGTTSATTTAGTFYLTITPKFSLVFTSNPCGGGVVDITASIVAGPPLGGYFMVITLNQGAFPNGYFFGLEPFLAEVVSQAQTPGFVGALNGAGAFTLGPICGLPPGFFTFYGVALAFATPTIDFPINATTPETISP